MKQFLDYQQQDGVALLTMNRPQERNVLSDPSQFREFVDVCRLINDDLSVRCVILTGSGSAFCAGGNVKDMKERTGMFAGSPVEVRDNYRRGIQRIPLAFYELEAPTIAAVNGPAIGAGCDLACLCDIRIASETASFAESFVKLGIVPGDGGAWLLQRAVGLSKASEMSFTGDAINANEALACGLVSRVVPAARLLDEARALASRIAANPSTALRLCKRLIREAQGARLDTVLEMSAAFQALAHHTADHATAVEKMSAKIQAKAMARREPNS
ncbi:MAG: crotonase/enoyl-CoA hydratase family protein [Alphaproteobacteria bacterium]|nr:crotonase/enoyl-CoA hydratase family protein [Alphaproteobacteria bacterium]